MKTNMLLILLAISNVLQLSLAAYSTKMPGYILNFDVSAPNNLLKDTADHTTYNDDDIHSLISHNLGLLKNRNELPQNAKSLISNSGSRNLLSQEKLNYLFLVERSSSRPLFNEEARNAAGLQQNHQDVLLNVCHPDSSTECVLDSLFDVENTNSVLNQLKKSSGLEAPEAFLYNSNTGADASEKPTLVPTIDGNGNMFIQDQTSKTAFKIASNLDSCVNNILQGKYTIDVQNGVVTKTNHNSNTEGVNSFTIPAGAKSMFNLFMTDVCSIWGISTLIRRDANPSLFVFHLESLSGLETLLTTDQQLMIDEIFNIAYGKFMKNILSRYDSNQVSGQVLMLNPSHNTRNTLVENESFAQTRSERRQVRLLEEDDDSTILTQSVVNPTTTIIFKSVLIAFALVTAWVCIEMFRIDVQKDSVVYAKFLAADYFRR